MSLESNIKKWVILDNNYKKLNEEIKEIREKKSIINNNIIQYFSTNNIKNPTINISDGKLNISNIKQLDNALTYKFLENCFYEYFDDKDKTKELLDFIKSKRTFSINTTIRRIYNKK